MTYIYSSPACLKHAPGPDCAFAPARLQAVTAALKAPEFSQLTWHSAPPITQAYLRAVHTQDYIDAVLAPVPDGEERTFSHDTVAVAGTADAALAAAGLVACATEAVIKGETRNAFCLASPGGHHAEADSACGYCFFNHVATAAVIAQKFLKQPRVAVIDIDAHHGNGTQSIFWNHEDRLFISLHEESPLSGFVNETGSWGNIMNIPLTTGSDGAAFRQAIKSQVLPKIISFKPDIMFVSAGFDTHKDDPMSGLCLNVDDYEQIARSVTECANSACQGRLVAVLEGGYNLDILGPSVAAFVKGMMGI